MLTYLMFGLALAFAGWHIWTKGLFGRQDLKNIAAISLWGGSLYFLFTYLYLLHIGMAVQNFYNGGDGTTFSYVNEANQTITKTVFDVADSQVGEYFALLKADEGALTVLSSLLPALVFILCFYFVYRYVTLLWFARAKEKKEAD